MSEKKAQINGVEMFWVEAGMGEPLLLLHGFPFDHTMWLSQLDYFSKAGWRVLAPDLRGFGKSGIAPGDVNTMEALAVDVAALLDHLKIEKATMLGFSMGGYITFAFYRLYPQRIRAMILADTKADPDTSEGRNLRYKTLEAVRQKGSGAIAESMIPGLFAPETYRDKPDLVAQLSGIIERIHPETIIATLPGLAERPDSTPLLSQIKVPALIIHGVDDKLMPLDKAKAMAQAIPDWQFSAVPHAGHMANLENPEFFNRALVTFLKELK
ncbi:MAG: alpha/beta hydrolase [Chloroflexi bacterium]|uniref:Alpha/beta hydrolase n=1 Tax=Candidatus Chlorohelix allophototropha TaxID=3003348 RepID=A0A8T7LU66_9CHLR|nr:alpha/beta hydrolase [Chloroflexota bacterium]WJW66315.1 alpha/beta hydrolase [Chloroflexota bacterium L227-S17]